MLDGPPSKNIAAYGEHFQNTYLDFHILKNCALFTYHSVISKYEPNLRVCNGRFTTL